jgi:arylamine N-acetyltransferase
MEHRTPISTNEAALLDLLIDHLNIDRQKPSIAALTGLVTAFMMHVPFENVSKLFYKKQHNLRTLPSLKQYLDGIENYNFGGTCYSNNSYLHLLLTYLGYDAMLCGADMSHPDVHLVNMVSVEGREFLVDAGYAAPFLKPLPRDLNEDHIVAHGRDRYVLKPKGENGNSRLDLYRDGQLRHGYTAKPIHRKIEYFTRQIDQSFSSESTFMNSLLLVRLFPARSIVIHNLSVIESKGTDFHIHRLSDRVELPALVEEHFSIPREVVAAAISELGEFGDAWS